MNASVNPDHGYDLPLKYVLMVWCMIATVLVAAAVAMAGRMAINAGPTGQGIYAAMLLVTGLEAWGFMRLLTTAGMDRISALSVLGVVFVALWVVPFACNAFATPDHWLLILAAPPLMAMSPFSVGLQARRRICYWSAIPVLVVLCIWLAPGEVPVKALSFKEKSAFLVQVALYCYMAYLPFIALALYVWRRAYWLPVVGYMFLLVLLGAVCFMLGDSAVRSQYLFVASAFMFSTCLYYCLIRLTAGISGKVMRYTCFILACWQAYALLHNTYISLAMAHASAKLMPPVY